MDNAQIQVIPGMSLSYRIFVLKAVERYGQMPRAPGPRLSWGLWHKDIGFQRVIKAFGGIVKRLVDMFVATALRCSLR